MKVPFALHYISNAEIPSREANSVQVMKMCAAFAPHCQGLVLYGRATDQAEEGAFRHYGVPEVFRLIRVSSRRVRVIGRLLHSYRLLTRLDQEAKEGWLYGRDYHTLALSVLLNKPRLPIVFEAHQPPGDPVERFVMERVLKSPRFRHLVVISDALAEEYKRRFPYLDPTRITVAHDGADEPSDPPSEESSSSPPSGEGLQLGYVGSLYPGKGMETIERLHARMPDCTFHVVGGKPEDLAQWKERLKASNVIFHGFLPHAEAQEVLRGFDVLLAPYSRSVLIGGGITDIARWMSPLKIFEYMASGKPMIVSDLPVIREVLRHDENALLADAEDDAAWERCVRELARDPQRGERLAKRARQDLQERYTWARRAETILSDLMKGS